MSSSSTPRTRTARTPRTPRTDDQRLVIDWELNPYVNEHIKFPRGFGDWAFRVVGESETHYVQRMTYTDAKKQLKERLAGKGYNGRITVTVRP